MRILILSNDPELALLRQHVLRKDGHESLAPLSEKEIERTMDELDGDFDVALLCHRIPDGRARELIRRFRLKNPGGKIVAIVHMYGEWPQIEADRYVVGNDGPEALLRVMAEVAAERASAALNGN
jgi:DNA-binding response OmpR family regulator